MANPNYVAGSADWKQNRPYAQYTSSSMTTAGKRSFQYRALRGVARKSTLDWKLAGFLDLGKRTWVAELRGSRHHRVLRERRPRERVHPVGRQLRLDREREPALAALGGSTWSAEFHLWAMEWNATDVNLYLDDKLVYDFKVSRVTSGKNPYTGNPFYILVNLAIGANGGDPSNTTFPLTYKVDYVRVYQ